MNTIHATLLIVDDDPVFTMFVRQLVKALGEDFPCATESAGTCEHALEELARADFDLVLLDYHLPGKDGLEMLSIIRRMPAQRQPAVVMLTGSGSETVAVEAMKCGARDYLPKAGLAVPILLRTLRSAMAQKQLANEVARRDEAMHADLEMARHFQRSLLPDSYPTFPRGVPEAESALRFCHRFIPASHLAGDFFTVLQLSDTLAGVFICDVMGHGVRSALVTAIVRALVDYAAPGATDPGKFLYRMNQRLTGLLKPGQDLLFATAFYMIADSGKGRLRYATAGHPSPLHIKPGEESVVALPSPVDPGPALGLFNDAVYRVKETGLAEGDILLLYTDGLFEATNETGEEYGRKRLQASLHKHLHLPQPDLCDSVIGDTRAFADGVAIADDICLLTVQAVRVGNPTNHLRVSAPGSKLRNQAQP